jgi:hypothetical protein
MFLAFSFLDHTAILIFKARVMSSRRWKTKLMYTSF